MAVAKKKKILWFALTGVAILAALFAFLRLRSHSRFTAACEIQMNSRGSFLEKIGEAMTVHSDIKGTAQIAFARPWLRVDWAPQFSIRVGESSQKSQTDLLNALGRETVWAKVSTDGTITEVRYLPRTEVTKDLQEVVLNTSKMMLMQVAQGYFLEHAWSEGEFAGTDIWGANTRALSQGQKTSDAGQVLVETKSALPTATTMAGRGSFQISFQKLKMRLTGRQVLTNRLQLGSSETTYDVACEKTYTENPLAVPDTTFAATTPWLTIDTESRKHTTLTENLKGKTIEAVLTQAKSFRKNGKGYGPIADVSRELQDFLYLHPDQASKYYDLAIQLGAKHPLFNEILKALSRVSGPESEKALLDLVDVHAKDADTTKKILIAIGLSEKPGTATALALEKWGADADFAEAQMADLMLGHIAYQLHVQGTDPARASAIDQRLVTKLENATSDPERSHWLSALGNTGLCSNLGALRQQMHAPTAYVTEKALMAIRFCEGPEIQELLWRVFLQRPELNSTFFSALNMRYERGLPIAELTNLIEDWAANPPPNTPEDNLQRTRDWLKNRP